MFNRMKCQVYPQPTHLNVLLYKKLFPSIWFYFLNVYYTHSQCQFFEINLRSVFCTLYSLDIHFIFESQCFIYLRKRTFDLCKIYLHFT